jgi:hypothetical protein
MISPNAGFPPRWTALVLLLVGIFHTVRAEVIDATTYPRTIDRPEGSVKIHHPVIENWERFRTLTGRTPVEVTTSGGTNTRVGSVAFEVDTVIHFEDRLASLDNPRIVSIRLDGGRSPPDVDGLVREAARSGAEHVSLDFLLRSLPEDFKIPAGARATPQLNFKPPRVVISKRPMRLMLIDGPPAGVPIASTALEFVVNTDWDVFHDTQSDSWYILDRGYWLKNSMLASGDWIATTELPRDFLTLQVSSDWPQVAAALPARKAENPPLPITVSYEPTELIVIDGDLQMEAIPGTGLEFVANTRSDLFLLEGRYYLLLSGRWFSTKNLKRQWSAVRKLPAAFSQIPEDHSRAYVLASVPGTGAARLAAIEAAIPRVAVVSLGEAKAMEVPYVGEPSFVEIQGTGLRRAENTPYQVIMHNNFYYLCHEGAWYSSTDPVGSWEVAREIPEAIYTIPPTDPAYNVTYVRLESFDDSSGQAAYTSTSGYYSRYYTGSTMVYGTGWYHPGYYRHSVYWRYPHTYGYPGVWGPYWPYGYHYSATFEVNRPEKDWEWNLDGSKREVRDYGPSNYIGSGRYVMHDSKVYKGDGRDRPEATQRLADENAGSDDFYSGPDGGVYRRVDETWEEYSDGTWKLLATADDRLTANLDKQYAMRQAAYRDYDRFRDQ